MYNLVEIKSMVLDSVSKTGKQILDILRDDIRKNIIDNVVQGRSPYFNSIEQLHNSTFTHVHQLITQHITWDESPQGGVYWREIYHDFETAVEEGDISYALDYLQLEPKRTLLELD